MKIFFYEGSFYRRDKKGLPYQNYTHLIAQEITPDIALVVGVRILIPEAICNLPPKGILGVHDSLLPSYRGFSPLNWSILNGESQTGVTLFFLNQKMDAGDIVGHKRVTIGPDETAPEVYEKVCNATVELVLEQFLRLEQGAAERMVQDERRATYTCARTPQDGMIDWNRPTREIYNRIRALTYPYPGAFTFLGQTKVPIWKAKPLENSPAYVGRIPGRVIRRSEIEGYADVLTGDGILRILTVQQDMDLKPVPASQLFRSVRLTLGLSPEDLLGRIKILETKLQEKNGKRLGKNKK